MFPLHERIKRHDSPRLLRDMEELQWFPPQRVAQLQLQRLRDFLQDVALNVPYYRDVFAQIGFDPAATGPFGPFGANINFDSTRRQGLELEAKYALSASTDLRANAAWRQARFIGGVYAGNDVALVPGKTLALRADWRPAAGHSLNAGVNWVSSQSPDFSNACKIPAYTTVDVRYALQYRNAEFALGAANLFNRKYYTQAFGCNGGTTTSIYPEAGRIVTASVRVKF